jgi:hypothetical protein
MSGLSRETPRPLTLRTLLLWGTGIHKPQVTGTDSASVFNDEYVTAPTANITTDQTNSASYYVRIPLLC